MTAIRSMLRRAGGLCQLFAGFSATPRLLQPEAGFAQKQVAQNGPPNRRCPLGFEGFDYFQTAGCGST
jgi:hypothetical protein